MLTLPAIISGFMRLLLVLAAIVGFFATVICSPIGLIMFLIKREDIKKSSKLEKKKFYKLVKLLVFGGPCIFIVTFIIWAILTLINTFFGLQIITPSI